MRNATKLLLGVTLAAFGAGCSHTVMAPEAKLVADESSPGFVDRMASQSTVNENDAMRGILLLLDGEDTAKTFRDRVDTLMQRGIADDTWDYDAHEAITKGKLAYMVYRACKLNGGVVLTLTGPSHALLSSRDAVQGLHGHGPVLQRGHGHGVRFGDAAGG